MAATTLTPGQTLGHFRLIEEIGAGGMGIVYRARDTRLERDVAVKVLNGKALGGDLARKRFRHEALILSRLNHPNVESVYDFHSEQGVDYLVMEYIPGVSLNERLEKNGALPEREVLEVGIQLSRGLAAAHAQRILHRDLKPDNLRVTPDNVLKILDFGLAQWFSLPDDATLTTDETVAPPQNPTAGTPAYLSPEQVNGKEPDMRSDIYSAGVVLYELATGSRPFPYKGQMLADAILDSLPPAPRLKNKDISPDLEAVILKCLEKGPELRYQTASELLDDLKELARGSGPHRPVAVRPTPGWRSKRWWALAGIFAVVLVVAVGMFLRSRVGTEARTHPIHSIAILPFVEASSSAGQDYFADGMTEELISQLTQVSGMRVISRSSVMQYKGTKSPISDIARQLNVDGIIEGTVYRVGNRIRITVELIDAASGRNLWSRSYERDFGDALALQTEVARSIVDEVQVKLTPQEQEQLAARPPPVADNTYDAYLQGRYHLNKRTPADLKIAVAKFQQAVSQDPNYARAYVGLADAYALLGVYRALPAAQALQSAKSAAQKALELDPRLGEAHASLAAIRFSYLEWTGAEDEFRSALRLNPGYAPAHHWYAMYLASQARFDEALHQIGLAETLDPNSSIIKANVAWCLYLARRYDEAIAKSKQVLASDPGFVVAHDYLGQAFLEKGQFESAISELSTAVQLGGETPFYLAELANAYASAGETEKARSLLRELESESNGGNVSPADLALVYAGLHDDTKATELLERAVRERSPGVLSLKVSPRYDGLRSNPRFAALVERLGGKSAPLAGLRGFGRILPAEASFGLVPTPAR